MAGPEAAYGGARDVPRGLQDCPKLPRVGAHAGFKNSPRSHPPSKTAQEGRQTAQGAPETTQEAPRLPEGPPERIGGISRPAAYIC